MTSVIEQPKTVEMIAIPAPKFSIGQSVNIGDYREQGEILGWMYAPVDPHKSPEDSHFPVWEAGFNYYVYSVCYCEALGKSYESWDTLHESVLTPIV